MTSRQSTGHFFVKGAMGLGLLLGVSAVYSSVGKSSTAVAAVPPATTAMKDIPKPFASLVSMPEVDHKAIHDAEELAVAACMKSQGFRYTPQPFKPEIQRLQPLGNVDMAREHGYGIADGFDRGDQTIPENDTANNVDIKDLSPDQQQAWNKALLGTPPGPEDIKDSTNSIEIAGGPVIALDPTSCASRGRSDVYGDDLHWQHLQATITHLQNQVYARALPYSGIADPALREAVGKWRACMNGKGFDYERPLVAGDIIRDGASRSLVDQQSVRSFEIKVATADAECFRDTGMGVVVSAQIATYEQQLWSANSDVISEFVERRKKAVERARVLLDPSER